MGMNVAAVNLYSPINKFDQFFAIWKWTRVIKAAGWVYKASADGTGASGNKETAGAFLLDKWGPGGIVSGHTQLGSQSGSSATINTITNNTVNITGLSGMTSSSVGHALTLSGATNAGNNGNFTITNFVSSSSVDIFNANPAVAEATSLTWSERISGSGTITWSSLSAAREQTIGGLSDMDTSSPAQYLYLTGSAFSVNNGVFQILKRLSSTSVVIINSAGVSDSASGNWTKLDPLLDVYPGVNLAAGSWTVYQGPSTLKIPINAASTGTFIKGENITQSGSNAQGELIGYQYDTPTAQGYIVVMPRQDGYATGALGWNTSPSTITGTSSAATVTTANGSVPIEYVRETVYQKANTTNVSGSVYYQVVDGYGESTSRFTSLLTATGCTNIVAPGAGGTGNGFPVNGTMAVRGSGGSTAGAALIQTASIVLGRTSVFAANASYTDLSSADGTCTAIIGVTNVGTISEGFFGLGFWRLDNNEDGDVDPYVWFAPHAGAAYSEARASASTATNVEHFCMAQTSTNTWCKGWRRRGFSTNDMMQSFQFATIGTAISSSTNFTLAVGNGIDPDSVATSINTSNPIDTRVRDPIWVVSLQITAGALQPFGKMRKGTLRWGFYVPGFVLGDTFDNRMFVQLANTIGPMVLGPWDGSSPLYVA